LIADQTIEIVKKRAEEVAQIEKMNRFIEAKENYERLQQDIDYSKQQLQYFNEEEKAADETP
jgi:hypothetical protein